MLPIYNSYLNNSLPIFIERLCNYDFLNYNPSDPKILELWNKSVNFADSNIIRSNGSFLGGGHLYRFGPMSALVAIEKILKYGNHYTILISGDTRGVNQFTESKIPQIYNENLEFDYRKPNWKLLTDKIKLYPKVVIRATPNIFLFLTSDSAFIEAIDTVKNHIHSLCTTDWEPFFRKPKNILVNDNMINWKTGVNFYTCENGFKHTLPIFILDNLYAMNILNMANKRKYVNDDIFTFGDVSDCACGKKRLNFNIETHVDNKFRPNLDLIEKLKDHYTNLQFTRSSVYFSTMSQTMSKNDEEIIRSWFGDLEFINGKRLLTGRGKFYPFWEGSSKSTEYNFKP
jgi:hypothetical protein